MTVGLNRASIFALKKEVAPGDYLQPSSASEFVPLRPGNTLNFEPEQLESDELLNDIGAAKSLTGKEVVSGSHSAYLRHSGVEGQEPELGVLYESVMGSKYVAAAEYDTTTGSTTTVINMPASEGANFRQGQALLIKDPAGSSIRNIRSISGDALTLNFALSSAPGSGVNTGKAITYLPQASGHPTFSTTKYIGNGFAVESSAGNTTTECSVTADANGFGEVEFSYEGTKYFFNPITIGATNKFLDFTDDDGTFAVSVAEQIYKTPQELAAALEAALNNSASTESYSVVYNNSNGKFVIATSTSSLLSLLWDSGSNALSSIGSTLGFVVSADDDGLTSYTSDNAQTYTPAYTPAYDSADAIIIKGAELFIGNQLDNVCICAQSVSITVSKETEDVDCICEETGISEKIPVSRSAEMSVTATLNKYDSALLDALLNNKGIQAMLNCGPKTGGNWSPGRCFNFYLQNCTVSSYTTTGDNFIQAEITLRGFVTSTQKDCYINFV